MNLLLLFEEDRLKGEVGAEGRFFVGGARARHMREVLKVRPGQQLRAGLLNGPSGSAAVEALRAEGIEVQASLDTPPEVPLVDLLLAIPRPKSLKKLLPELSALGVRRLTLMRTWRVERPYLSVKLLEPSQYRPLLHEGLMQARATLEPEVLIEPLFKPFVEDRLPAQLIGRRGLVAHPGAATRLASVRLSQEPVTLAVGPEGGLLPYEVQALERAGMTAVSAGERILRVETACVALLAQLQLLRALSSSS